MRSCPDLPALMDEIHETADVALVSMPWAPPTEPCLGLSILKQCLQNEEIGARVFHLAPMLLRWCTIETYAFLADRWAFNDFLFTHIIDVGIDKGQEQALRDQAALYAEASHDGRYADTESMLNLAWNMRNRIVPEFIEYSMQRIVRSRPKLIGLSCLFDQTIASAALAKRLKDVLPQVPIVLGGYALEGPPGLTAERAFPWIDLIVAGDGEQAIVELARDALAGKSVTARANASVKIMRTPRINLEDSPSPNYDDWFLDLDRLATSDRIRISTRVLPVESSRGCWWGQSQHCVFCGIDDDTLRYRQKGALKTRSMLSGMRERYGDYVFRFSDYIMPKEYYTELLPALAHEKKKYRLHTELKANHPPERVQLLSDAGFREIQPGIESFSTPVLKEMHKGVTSIQNVSLLKAGYLYEVTVHYNILFGLPGDVASTYRDMLRRIPQLYHLIPPVTCTDTAITRFAPLQSDPNRFGLCKPNVHHGRYDILFSREFLERSGFSLDSYAYFFEKNFDYSGDLIVLYRQLCQQVDHWKALHRERFVELSFDVVDDRVCVVNSRFREESRYRLSAPASAVYLECDNRPIGRLRIQRQLEEKGRGLSEPAFIEAIAQLASKRLIWTEGELILGLAVPRPVATERRDSRWPQTWLSLWEGDSAITNTLDNIIR